MKNLFLLIFIFTYCSLQAQVNSSNDAAEVMKGFAKNFDKIISGDFTVSRTETSTAFNFEKDVCSSTIEFDASSISSDSVVRHLITLNENEQVYFNRDTIYHLYHKGKSCVIIATGKRGYINELNYLRKYIFSPYLFKGSKRNYFLNGLVSEDFGWYQIRDGSVHDSLNSQYWLHFLNLRANDNNPTGIAVDVKISNNKSEFTYYKYTRVDKFATATVEYIISPLKKELNQLKTFDINYYLKNYTITYGK